MKRIIVTTLILLLLVVPVSASWGSGLCANFAGAGIWKWDGNTWSQVTPNSPIAMAASGSLLYGNFGMGAGIWKWDGTTWIQITPNNPQSMAASGLLLYGNFGAGAGVWKWDSDAWSQITPNSPIAMAATSSLLYGNFGTGAGIWKYDGNAWSQVTPNSPTAMAASGSLLYGNFGAGAGIWKWDGSTWSQVTPNNPEAMAVSDNSFYGDFGASGIWKWDGVSWSQVTPSDPQNISVSGSILYGDFGESGIWQWDGNAWSQTTPNNPISMVSYSQAGLSGSLDTSFGDGGVGTIDFGSSEEVARAIAIQPDGRIIVGGYADLPAGRLFAVARLLHNGSLDPAFGIGGKLSTSIPGSTWNIVNGLAIQTDGKIIAAGGYSQFVVARYNANGTLDTSFGGTGIIATQAGVSQSRAYSVALQTDGKIIAGGSSDLYSPYGVRFTLIRYNANGTLDTTFGTGGIVQTLVEGFTATIRSVTLQPDGRIVAGGYAYTGSNYDFALARFNADGTLDNTFGNGGMLTAAIGTGEDNCWAVRLQTDGKIVAAGDMVSGGASSFALLRFETNGTIDTTFGSGGPVTTNFGVNSSAYGLTIQTNGRIVAAGYAFNLGFALARYLPDGTLDATFGTGGKASTNEGGLSLASALALQVDGKIVAAGFSSTDGAKDFAVVRFWP